MTQRPVSLTVIACVYVATGAIGFVFHVNEFTWQHPFHDEILWISLLRLLAIVCGVFMLRGSNWARWLAIAWIACHVILSFFHSPVQLTVHVLLCAAFAYFLFRPRAEQYFRHKTLAT